MFSKKEKITLLIVCDDKNKYRVYAELLAGLLSQSKEQNEDGELKPIVTATVQSEKVYLANTPSMTSETRVLFIGTFKESLMQQENTVIKYENFGMKYGWLGKKAVLFVDKENLDPIYHEELVKLGEKYYSKSVQGLNQEDVLQQDEEKEDIENPDSNPKENKINNFFGSKLKSIPGSQNDVAKKIASGVSLAAAGVLAVGSFLPMIAVPATYTSIKKLSSSKKINEVIKKEQYNCLVRAFYLEGLKSFLEA